MEEWKKGWLEEGEGDENGPFSMFRTPDGNSPSGSQPHLGIKNFRPFTLDLYSDFCSLSPLLDQREFQGSARVDRD